MFNIPQPPVMNHYVHSRLYWTDIQCEYLLNQRMCRNDEFWGLASWNRSEFWRSIAHKINECFGTHYSKTQVKNKWKNLLREYLVSIFYINYHIIIYVLMVLILLGRSRV